MGIVPRGSKLVLALATVLWLGQSPAATVPMMAQYAAPFQKPDLLSVMTYNVKGLPWPAASGRDADLEKIAVRLSEMRTRGAQPRIVLLQEAFTDEARAIGTKAGYRYVIRGPQFAPPASSKLLVMDKDFAQQASWIKGETEGNWVDSGLVILSDYPVEKVRRYAFPQGVCAGYDCLATKGVVIAWVRVPGISGPVAIANTHLNSRKSSGVSFARANQAFAWQMAAIRQYVSATVTPQTPIIFGGDFNIGVDKNRTAESRGSKHPLPGSTEALAFASANGMISREAQVDATIAKTKGRDRQFFRNGQGTNLGVINLRVPFGRERNGSQLSDHIGFVVRYSIANSAANRIHNTIQPS